MHARTAGSRLVAALAVAGIVASSPQAFAPSAAPGPKYYFQLREVKAAADLDPALKAYAGDALKAELASRPEWASDIDAQGADAVVAELKRRNLRGFYVTVRVDSFTSGVKDPAPGGRLKRLSVNVRLAVVGTTMPEEKLAFGGDGEAGVESEVPEKRMDAERIELAKAAIKDAVKQAVDQAVLKLGVAKAGPKKKKK